MLRGSSNLPPFNHSSVLEHSPCNHRVEENSVALLSFHLFLSSLLPSAFSSSYWLAHAESVYPLILCLTSFRSLPSPPRLTGLRSCRYRSIIRLSSALSKNTHSKSLDFGDWPSPTPRPAAGGRFGDQLLAEYLRSSASPTDLRVRNTSLQIVTQTSPV